MDDTSDCSQVEMYTWYIGLAGTGLWVVSEILNHLPPGMIKSGSVIELLRDIVKVIYSKIRESSKVTANSV